MRDALQRRCVTALSVERRGNSGFEFEADADFSSHLEAFDPTLAKVLVRCRAEGDAAPSLRQVRRLKPRSEHGWRSRRRFLCSAPRVTAAWGGTAGSTKGKCWRSRRRSTMAARP